jgi:hypothetical protein
MRQDALRRRWQRFPQLGPVPEKWVHDEPPPTLDEMLRAFYVEPIAECLNRPSPLLRLLEKGGS